MAQAPSKYHPLVVTLHWVVAFILIVALVMGTFVLQEIPNSNPEKINALRGHMIAGGLLLVLTLIRLIVRFKTTDPVHATTNNALLDKIGIIVHKLLNLLVLVMAFSGIAMAVQVGLPDIVFGGSGTPLPENFNHLTARAVHGITATMLIAIIALHIAGAVYHQIILKDGLMSRMWFGKR